MYISRYFVFLYYLKNFNYAGETIVTHLSDIGQFNQMQFIPVPLVYLWIAVFICMIVWLLEKLIIKLFKI